MSPSAPDVSAVTTIAVASTFTADPVETALRFWMQELQVPATILFAPYGQVFHQLLDPSSLFSTNQRGINVLVVRLDDLTSVDPGSDPNPREDERSAKDPQTAALANRAEVGHPDQAGVDLGSFVSSVKSAMERAAIPHLICFCPASRSTESGDVGFHRRWEDRLAAALREIPGVEVVTSAELMFAYPISETFDPEGDALARIPYTPAFYTALGTMIARRLFASLSAPYKVIAVDADQTLWSGVCGEDGPDGVGFDPPRLAIQEFLKRQHDAGMILCLCSKNNEEDVAAVFDRRPEMILRRDHFAGWRVNWKPKSENLLSLASELRLGLESFLFLDDDPVACAEVQANCPEVLTLALPQEPEAIAPFLGKIWAFDHLKVTSEAADRTGFYRQSAQRDEFKREALTLKEFLSGLRLRVHVAALASDDLARASELTRRTNQFNMTTIRRSEAALRSLVQSPGPECLVVRVKDRFGDYGVVGVMIVAPAPGALSVDTFLLSCRALGRGVEHRMLAHAGEIALQRGLESVDVLFRPSGRNQPALDFLESVGSPSKKVLDGEAVFQFPAHLASAMRYDPPAESNRESTRADPAALSVRAEVDARAKAALLSSIARELSDVGQIAGAIAAQARDRPDSNVPYLAPATDCEKQVAEMFGAVLGVQHVGVNDSFFGLGGHSLLAMMLINRLRAAFHVEFPVDVLFEVEFTVARAVQTINAYQTRQASPEDTDALMQLIETLSDDEVRTLLAEHRGPVPARGGGEKG
ncbi:MAG: HAD-IIIC family phosphatase [Acidobacteriota bacterium]|nr:HAD-IIIC family phosphatase [Acidobacteriota bacterium]